MVKSIICRDYNGKEYTFREHEYIDHESVYGVIVEDGKILLVEHPVSKGWEFPGGGVEYNEDTPTALRREIKEETNLETSGEITLIKSTTEYYYDLGTREPWKSVRNFYTISSYTGNLRTSGNNDDVSRAQFIDFETLGEINLTDTVKDVIETVSGL